MLAKELAQQPARCRSSFRVRREPASKLVSSVIEMRRNLIIILYVIAAFLAGYGHGRWYAAPVAVAARTTRIPLYYRCPMHPSFRSDKPGVSPCCNMALEPVFSESASSAIGSLPPGALHLTAGQEQLIGVQYGVAEYASVSRITRGSGRVEVNANNIARIQTKLEGYIDHMYVHAPGERVAQGQLLFSIYNRRTYAMAQMQFLQASMDSTGMSLPATDLAHPNDRRLAAAEALRSARQQLEMMGFTSTQMDAVSRAQQPLFSLPVHAPISGVILELNAVLNSKPGMEPLLTIADLSTVWIPASFPAGATIRPGQPATLIVPSLPRVVFHGSVVSVLPELDASTESAKALLQFGNPAELLKPGMYGEVELPSASLKKLTVPLQAVLDRGRNQTVFVDRGSGVLEPRQVKTGERFGDRVEIIQGVAPGQRIVTSGNFLLDSESQLRAIER